MEVAATTVVVVEASSITHRRRRICRMDTRRRRRRMCTMATRRHHLMDILMDHRRKVCVFVGNSHSFVLGSWILDQECVVNMLWDRSKINSLHSLSFFLFPFW
jgi:hypothetical protein